MTNKRVTIQLTGMAWRDRAPNPGWPAYACGEAPGLAVCNMIGLPTYTGGHQWTIVHIASGLRLWTQIAFPTRRAALAVVSKLAPLADWQQNRAWFYKDQGKRHSVLKPLEDLRRRIWVEQAEKEENDNV